MKKRVHKGSSLVMVIVIMGIISVLGLSLSTLAITTYKSRMVNSTAKINLYAAEAGIDEVYGIIGETVDKAINYGNSMVSAIDLEQIKMDKISKLFEDYPEFYKFEDKEDVLSLENTTINPTGMPLELIDLALLYLDGNGQVSATIDEDRLKNYQNQQFQYYYKSYVNNGKEALGDESKEENLKEAIENTLNYKFTLSEESNKPQISLLENNTFSTTIGNNNPYSLRIKSEFIDSKENIRKAIEIEYKLDVPEYNEVYYIKDTKFPKNVVWEKAIAADGNMNIQGAKVNVNGEVYIKGSTEGGVNLNGVSPSLTLEQKLATRENINILAANSSFTSKDSIYANNIIIQKNEIYNADGSNFNITNSKAALFLRDDLELNSNNSKVNLSGAFYGLYDGPDDSGNESFKGNEHSSSVVINSEDVKTGGSSLNIVGDVIIQGTAYIGTTPSEYQTGESISIRGNYKAYMKGLTIDSATSNGKSLKSDSVIFEYMDPLSVVSLFSDGTPLLAPDKSKYFEVYNEEFKGSSEETDKLETRGVNITGNVIATAGAIINGESVKPSQLTPDEGTIKEKTRELKRNIFYMGDITPTDSEVFNEKEVKRDVSTLVNYGMLIGKTKAPSGNTINNNQEVVILDASNTSYAFVGENGTIPSAASKSYNVDNSFKGIIITSGDVYITGELNFTGTIITKGNIIFLDSDEKNIIYNSALVKKLVAENYEIFNSSDPNLVVYDEVGQNNNINTDTLKSKIIKRSNWKLLK